FLAVGLKEPERSWIIGVTDGCDLVSPAVLPFEIGNALSSLARRKIISKKQLPVVWDAVMAIPVELADIDIRAALILAGYFKIYAYDAYFLQCAIETRSTLLTLDKGMRRIARELDIKLLEQS
ncbi:MAG: type II toxin-antitoxin system VapC family toxin, partial [Kiritimatiellae bacterium]|nr:type II toxin-antitoxin system VapC family toxin [Kiritimatiellia bacterium]